MPDKYVLDSSVIAAIFFKEDASSRAANAVAERELITVDLAIAEVSNVAWKKVIIFKEEEDIIKHALKMSIEFINTACEVITANELADRAFQISLKEKISFYDSLFLSAAEKSNVPLLTLDKRLKKTDFNVELL
jgi:predicted nucleic acid-binding protein